MEAVHQLDLDWEAEGVTYGFGPSTPDELREALGPFLLVATVANDIIGYCRGEVHVSRDQNLQSDGAKLAISRHPDQQLYKKITLFIIINLIN